MPKAKVAVLRTKPATVLDDISTGSSSSPGGPAALARSRTTILKDNISWHYPFPSANTTPWQLEGTILALRANGFQDVVCVQNKTEVTDAFKGEDLNGYKPIFEATGSPSASTSATRTWAGSATSPRPEMLVLDKIYGEEIPIPDYFDGKNIVHLPTTKCHIYTVTTGAMKNAFGGLLSHKRHQTHTHIHETLVDLLAIQKEIHPGIFAVMDGTTAGNGPGPRIMEPVRKDVLLASSDQVAIDAVAAKMMGFDPMTIKYIALAHEAGLGIGRPDEIEIVGDTEAAARELGIQGRPRRFHQVRGLGDLVRADPLPAEDADPAADPLPGELLLLLLPRRPALAAPGEEDVRALARRVGLGPAVQRVPGERHAGRSRDALIPCLIS